jgi:hypothetical protein
VPAYNPTNPVTVGLATKADHFNRLWDNAQAIYDSLRSSNELWVPAAALRQHASGGCGALEDLLLSSGRYVQGLPFDATSIESASLAIAIPKRWDEGTITAQFFWMNTAGGSGGVVWQLAGVAASDDETLDVAVGSMQTATDAALAAKRVAVSAQTAAITIAGTPVAGDLTRMVVQRDPTAGGDTYASDAYLLGIVLRLTTAEANDA